MGRMRQIARSWRIVLVLVGIGIIGLAPFLGHRTALLFSPAYTRQLLAAQPLYIVDKDGTKIGWWRIKVDPTNILIGDTADVEVTYAANGELFHRPATTTPATPQERFRACTAENETRRLWNQPQIDCGPAPDRPGTAASTVPGPDTPVSSVTSLSARIVSSDLPFSPQDAVHEFNLASIFQSPSLSDNHIWHLTTEEGKTRPGRKSLIFAFDVQPPSFQQQQVDLGGLPVDVNGSRVAVKFEVRTPLGLSRQLSAVCTAAWGLTGAAFASPVLMLLFKSWLERRRRSRAPVRSRRRTASRARRQSASGPPGGSAPPDQG